MFMVVARYFALPIAVLHRPLWMFLTMPVACRPQSISVVVRLYSPLLATGCFLAILCITLTLISRFEAISRKIKAFPRESLTSFTTFARKGLMFPSSTKKLEADATGMLFSKGYTSEIRNVAHDIEKSIRQVLFAKHGKSISTESRILMDIVPEL